MRQLTSIAVVVLVGLALAGCPATSEPSSSEKGQAEQERVMQRAQAAVPVPKVNNFLTREAVAKWIERMDAPQKLFYVYVLADTGNVIGYYVAQTRPVTECALLTPPQRKERADLGEWSGDMKMASPGLDGVYYTGGCNSGEAFFFDAETDAFIGLSGLKYFVADQPLNLDADPISVAAD
ncbi:hypothetical protein ACJO2E_02565 [Marinobacter sp. M1N3S26]|uniref:hypothetical protein n=1 Tax=Marinobacter sp. M1N3S26 TaxID=3382299 RepID=UPI00387B8E23